MKIALLPFSRWNELQKALDECHSDEQIPKPDHSVMLGMFDGEKLVGAIGAERVWCISPLWLEKQYRGNGSARDLAMALSTYNLEGLREMCVTTSPHVERLIFDLGFVPIQGTLWRR